MTLGLIVLAAGASGREVALNRIVLIVVSSFIAAAAQTVSTNPPRFEDYPVVGTWNGPAAPLRLVTPSEREFRTQLTNASKQAPDFAGHYQFAGWGCGSACAAGAIIDLKTGTVFPPPLGGKGTGWKRWIFCGGIIEGRYVDYRRDSRLMILRCQEHFEGTSVHYLAWENAGFREILHVVEKQLK